MVGAVSEIKVPNPLDKHVGSRVRMRRLMLAMSQGKLGAALGITFQQVQKYEKGINRIGAGRSQQISQVLQVPVGFFFDGASDGSAPQKSEEGVPSLTVLDDFISSPQGLRLVQAFLRVESVEVRRRIVALVQSVASH